MKQFSAADIATRAEKPPKVRPFALDSGPGLNGVKALIITSGHDAMDVRVYAKQACSLQSLGADIKVVGKLEGKSQGPVPVLVVPKVKSRLVRFLWQPWRCMWRARNESADIIHFHDAEMLATLPLARMWWPHSKFIYDVHEDFANLMLVRDWLPSWIKPTVRVLTDMIEKGLASWADAIVGVTPPLTEKFRHSHKIVAYNFVSRHFFEQAGKASRRPKSREFDLVHLGYLSAQRALFLAEVLGECNRLRPHGRSIVIGLSPEVEELLKTRVPNNCRLLGKVPHEEIPRLLGNARVGIDIHPWLRPHLEVALPVKVCEYMAAGCGVVSSGMPVLNQILGEAGAEPGAAVIIDGGKPAEYARAAARMNEAIDKGADPGRNLRDLALVHMTWEQEATKLARLYLTLLGKTCAI